MFVQNRIPILMASDHGGYALKESCINRLKQHRGMHECVDLGVYSDQRVDYPLVAQRLCEQVLDRKAIGILICGTGIGVSIQANRYKGIRAALVTSVEMATLAKEHNDANVLCLGGRTTSCEQAMLYINAWLDATFEEGRHTRRIELLDCKL